MSTDFEFCVGFSNGDLGVVHYFQEKWIYKKKKAHKYGISSLVCYNNKDTSVIFTSGNDSLIKVWVVLDTDFEMTTTLEKVHSGPITSLVIVDKENDNLNPNLISFSNKEEIYYWDINEILNNGKNSYYKLNTNNFTQSINSFAPSICGKYFTLSNSEGVNLFINDKNENVLVSSTGNDGVLVDKDN